MSDFFRELIGVKCDFETEDNSYDGYVVKDISGDWIFVEDADESIYLNLRHVVSVKISEDDNSVRKFFGFGKKKEE